MAINGVSNTGFAAMAAGVQGQFKARMLSEVLDSAGLLELELADALQAVEATSNSLIAGGAAAAQVDLLGTLFDALA